MFFCVVVTPLVPVIWFPSTSILSPTGAIIDLVHQPHRSSDFMLLYYLNHLDLMETQTMSRHFLFICKAEYIKSKGQSIAQFTSADFARVDLEPAR